MEPCELLGKHAGLFRGCEGKTNESVGEIWVLIAFSSKKGFSKQVQSFGVDRTPI